MKTSLAVIIFLFSLNCVHSQNLDQTEQRINVIFNDSAAQYVLKDPANAIKEREFIWNNFEGYQITLVWHKESSFPLDWTYWEKFMNRFIKKDTLRSKTLELSNNLMALEKREHEKIVRHLASFFPENTSYDACVYLVVSTVPYAFCVEHDKIGIDITGDGWYYDPVYVLNVVIHELFHAGYRTFMADIKYLEKDPVDRESFLGSCYATILNEGMATYVGYKALDLFPTENRHDDYKLLEDDSNVKTAIAQVNDLIDKSGKLAIDSLNKLSWDFGIDKRAYYVTGGFIAKTIDKKFGREYLTGLLQKGGYDFIKEYNSIAPKEYSINLLSLD